MRPGDLDRIRRFYRDVLGQGSFDFPGTSMPDLANRTVAVAQQLYGTAAANGVRKAFTDRRIL